MSDSFHCVTLAEKIPQTYISIFDFELFSNHHNFSPFCLIDDPIPPLIDLLNYFKFLPLNLEIGVKLPKLGDTIDFKLRQRLHFFVLLPGRLIFLHQCQI